MSPALRVDLSLLVLIPASIIRIPGASLDPITTLHPRSQDRQFGFIAERPCTQSSNQMDNVWNPTLSRSGGSSRSAEAGRQDFFGRHTLEKRFPKTGLPGRLRHPALGSIASLRYDLSFDRAENGWPHTRERVEDPIPPSNERQKPRPAAIEESRFERNACEGRSGSFVAGDHRANSGAEVAPIATLCLQNPIA